MKSCTCGCENTTPRTREQIIEEFNNMQTRANKLKQELKYRDEYDDVYTNAKHAAALTKAVMTAQMDEGFTREEAFELTLTFITNQMLEG